MFIACLMFLFDYVKTSLTSGTNLFVKKISHIANEIKKELFFTTF